MPWGFRSVLFCFGVAAAMPAFPEATIFFTPQVYGAPRAVSNDGNMFACESEIWRRDIGWTEVASGFHITGVADAIQRASLRGAFYWQNGSINSSFGPMNTLAISSDGLSFVGGFTGRNNTVGFFCRNEQFVFADSYAQIDAISADGNTTAFSNGNPYVIPYLWIPGQGTPLAIANPRDFVQVNAVSDNGVVVGSCSSPYPGSHYEAFKIRTFGYEPVFVYGPGNTEALQITNDGKVIFGTGQSGHELSSDTTGPVNVLQMLCGLSLPNFDQVADITAMSRNGKTFVGLANNNFAGAVIITIDSLLAFAKADYYTIQEGQSLNVAAPGILANDLSFSGQSLTPEVVEPPAVGTLTFRPDGSFAYVPPAHQDTDVTFRYRVRSGSEVSSPVPVTIHIEAYNDPPTISAPSSLHAFTSNTLHFSGISIADIDAGQQSVQVSLSVDHGVVTFNGTTAPMVTMTATLTDLNSALQNVAYCSYPGFVGTDYLHIHADDQGHTGTGSGLADAVVPIDVTGVSPEIAYPVSAAPILGSLLRGTVEDLHTSDDRRMSWFNDPDSSICEVEFRSFSPFDQISECRFGVEVSSAREGLALELQIFDFQAQDWIVSSYNAPVHDTSFQLRVFQNASRIQDQNHELRARLFWSPINDEIPSQDGWLNSVDWCRWLLMP